MKENEIVYQIKITFQDVLDNSPQYVRDYYEKLNEEEKEKFIQDNLHSASKGAEFGLSEPIYDVISTIGQNLEYNNFIDTEQWWCPTCQMIVEPECVTYEETHDERCGGCGDVVL